MSSSARRPSRGSRASAASPAPVRASGARLEPLAVQFRETIRKDGSVREERLAFCDGEGRWVALVRCKSCADCAHLSGDVDPVLICRAAPAATEAASPSVRGALARSVWCIEADAPAAMVRLMKEPQQEAVVVDGDGHPIGLLAKAVGEGARPEVTAHACMEPAVVTVLHGATVERAREVQATSGVRTIPVVLAGRVVGRVGD